MRKGTRRVPIRYFSPLKEPYRAANLELDYNDPQVLGAYIPTSKSVSVLDVVCSTLEGDARDRAISLIAPYGSGKTSLLLSLAAWLEGKPKTNEAIAALLKRVRSIAPSTAQRCKRLLVDSKGYIVVPLSGYQGDVAVLMIHGLREALERHRLEGVWEKLKLSKSPSHQEALEAYRKTAKELGSLGYQGLAVIYDEFGKVLESQQGEAKPNDLFFLQSFAELCSRSGRERLLLVVSLHQGFAQYAQRLPSHLRTEWAKIEGRFRTIHYVEDSLQVYELIARALDQVRGPAYSELQDRIRHLAAAYAEATRKIPCFTSMKDLRTRQHLFEVTFPLHPMALYVLPRLSARVAQNERTLFHFLLGNDDQGMLRILDRRQWNEQRLRPVRVADLYDYFADLMVGDTGVGGTYRRLIEIKAALDRLDPNDTLHREIVKTVGLLSVLGERLQAPVNAEVLAFAMDALTSKKMKTVVVAVDYLVAKKILLHRRHTGEYRIWEGSDVDLLSVIRQQKAELETVLDVPRFVADKIRPPITFPHRHNEDLAITRVFEGQYFSSRELERLARTYVEGQWLRDVDGRIYYVLAESQAEIAQAREAAANLSHPQILVAIPKKPLHLTEVVLELAAIDQLLRDPGLISDDPVVRRELSEFADDSLVGLRRILARVQDPRATAATWWHRGKEVPHIVDGVTLRRYLSQQCGLLFSGTPRFNNEIINRRRPSSTVVNARKKVLRALLDRYGHPTLGLTGYGPDFSMFRAVYVIPGLYREHGPDTWRFASVDELEDSNLRGIMSAIHEFLINTQASPQSAAPLIGQLLDPPYGLRAGILPLLLAAALKTFKFPLNIMEDGVYVRELRAETFEHMVTTPDRITFQCVPLPKEVQDYLRGIEALFKQSESLSWQERATELDPLRKSVEVLYRWVHRLPPCAMVTQGISAEAKQFRALLVNAIDPIDLLFVKIPALAIGNRSADPKALWLSFESYHVVIATVEAWKREIEQVLPTYCALTAGVTRAILGLDKGSVDGVRDTLKQWADQLSPDIAEFLEDPQATGLLERIRSSYDTDQRLVESLGSLVTGKSLAHWDDSYLKQYQLGLLRLRETLMTTNKLLIKRNGIGKEKEIRNLIADPDLWRRLDQLDDTKRELLAYHLLAKG